jgi:hypothetical protein
MIFLRDREVDCVSDFFPCFFGLEFSGGYKIVWDADE